MRRISYTSSAGTITIDDVNTGRIDNVSKMLRLNDFDGDSMKNSLQTAKCIGMQGQHTVSGTADPKTVIAKIGFAPVFFSGNRWMCSGQPGMHTLRREVMRHFPLGEDGTLVYTDDTGTFEIGARIDELPHVAVKSGCYCECTLMFACDYPFWCRRVQSGLITASAGTPARVEVPNLGDVPSPISGIISHVSDMGDPDESGTYFYISNGGSSTKAIYFVKPLAAHEQLYFSLEYGNRFLVQKRMKYESYSTAWENAFDYIDFPASYEPCNIGAREAGNRGTEFIFSVMSNSGTLSLLLDYNYLFTVI